MTRYAPYTVGAAILIALFVVIYKLWPRGQDTPFLHRVLVVLAVGLFLAVLISMIDVVGR